MEPAVKRRRVEWNQRETELVAAGVVKAIIEHPDWTVTKMFEVAQNEAKLPKERRRNVTAFGASALVYAEILKRLAKMRDDAARAKPADGSDPTATLRAQIQELERANAELQHQLAEKPREVRIEPPPVDLAAAPTEQMLSILFLRFMGSLSGEREKLQGVLAEQLGNDRLKLEERMFRVESIVAAQANRPGNLPVAPAPSVGGSDYMPLILLAGGDRQDFQRIQAALTKASVRLQKVDTTKPPQSISIGQHDRLIIWTRGLPSGLAEGLESRSKRAVRIDGTAADVVAFVNSEAKKIRDEKRTASNGRKH